MDWASAVTPAAIWCKAVAMSGVTAGGPDDEPSLDSSPTAKNVGALCVRDIRLMPLARSSTVPFTGVSGANTGTCTCTCPPVFRGWGELVILVITWGWGPGDRNSRSQSSDIENAVKSKFTVPNMKSNE